MWHPFLKIRSVVRSLARLKGYELAGEGNNWHDLYRYRFYPRRLPPPLDGLSADPYSIPFRVDIGSVTSRVGFSYFEGGWHPFVQTLEEYGKDPHLRYEDSTLAKLYHRYRPANMQEVLLDHLQAPLQPLCNWPPDYDLIRWIWVLDRYQAATCLNRPGKEPRAGGWLFFGPQTEEYGRKEFRRLTEVYESIRNNGYQAALAGTDPVNGYFLKQGKEFRFVLLQGNHRVSALKALNYRNVDVLIRKGHPAVIDRSGLYRWTEAGGGIYPSRVAESLFDALFNGSGLQKARRYGLADAAGGTGC